MMISALFLVLLSNYMEERLQDRKPVLRVDCRMTDPEAESYQDEKKSLVPRAQVSELCALEIFICLFVFCRNLPNYLV